MSTAGQVPARRRWSRWLAVAAAAAVLTPAAALAHWVRAGAVVLRVVDTSVGESHWTPEQPLFVLLLGDDLRAGAGCGCADAIHLVAVPAGGGQATILDIPRDTRVEVPGHGTRKINAAFALGGPELTARTVSAFVGVPIPYTVTVGFDEFPRLIDALGGLTVDVPRRIRDPAAGANFAPGPVRMDGRAALAFSRSRNLPGGDFTRTEHQGLLLISALAELRARGTGTAAMLGHLAVLMRHTRLDGLGTTELVRLAQLAATIDPAAVRNVVMPGSGAMIRGTAYVVASPGAPGLFADLADDGILQDH